MEFCPKCGSVLMTKIKNSSCPRCNYTKKGAIDLSSKETITEKTEIAVIKKDVNTHPIVEEKCPKCEHKKSYSWSLQTRGSDESPTKFFKCVKCAHTWRDYS